VNNQKQDALDAILRLNLRPFIEKTFRQISGENFVDNWHIGAVSEGLRAVETGETKRLLVMLPPRSLKSTMISVAYPAWRLGHNPGCQIISASYGYDLATKLFRDCRDVMRSSWYRRVFPSTILSKDKSSESQLETTVHGYRFATSVGGAITGRGANLVIIDDPIKTAEAAASPKARELVNEWFRNSVLTRLNNKMDDAVIVTMQRTHNDDLAGFLIDLGNWTQICIPAEAPRTMSYKIGPTEEDVHVFQAGDLLDPIREPKSVLDEMRLSMGPKAYAAQYLQEPIPDGGTLFDWKWFKFYDRAAPPSFDFVFQSWDVASAVSETANYSVCTTWGVVGADKFYLIDVHRARHDQPSLLKLAAVLYDKYSPDVVVIEESGVGLTFWQSLCETLGERITRFRPKDSKLVRAEAQTVVLEAGQVFVPRDALWLDIYRREIIAFPGGAYDDQVDSTVQFLQNRVRLLALAVRFGRRHNTGHDIELPSLHPQVTVKLIGSRRLVRYFN
jgi:predicted phage terminase large subunit-like protein